MKSIVLPLLFLVFVSFAHAQEQKEIRYIALGDSYTIGTGALESESWPALLTEYLQLDGVEVKLIKNLGVAGWTSKEVIKYQLPQLKKLQPDFVTLLIGANDWVRQGSAAFFQVDLCVILDEVMAILPDGQQLVVVTIPDFSVTPVGSQYGRGRNISRGIAEFNRIIVREAKRRELLFVDLYTLSQQLGVDPSLVAKDGLHPSAKAYAQWAELIYNRIKLEMKDGMLLKMSQGDRK